MYICEKCKETFNKEVFLQKHIGLNQCKINNTDKSIKEITFPDDNKKVKNVNNKNNLYNNINNKLKILDEKYNLLTNKLDYIIEILTNKNKTNNINNISKMKPVKKEKLNINNEIVIKCLSKCNVDDDSELLYLYYYKDIEKEYLPIKKLKKAKLHIGMVMII